MKQLKCIIIVSFLSIFSFIFVIIACDNGTTSYDDVTITLPTEEIGVVETVLGKNGNITFYGSGAQFSATVNGSNNPLQTVTWTITGATDVQTNIIDGVLTVAHADHGETLTITATSTEDTGKFGTVVVTAVQCLPSDFYHKWQQDNASYSLSFKADELTEILGSSTIYYPINTWEALINNQEEEIMYPTGYNIIYIENSVPGSISIFLSVDNQKLLLIGSNYKTAYTKVD